MSSQSRIDLASVGPGVIWVYAFDEAGVCRARSPDEPVDLVGASGFVWAHVTLANARTRDWIEAQTCIPEDARAVVLSPDAHPRLDWGGDALWGVLLDVNQGFGDVSEEPTDLRFVLRPQFLVTARHRPVLSASAVRARIEAGATFADSASLFERLLVAAADSVGAAAHRIGLAIDEIEDRVLSETVSDETARLLGLRRSISKQDRLVQATMSVLGQLEQNRAESVVETYREVGRRVRQRVASFHSDLHLQGERARLLQEETAAQLAQATNKNLFVLTVVTTLLLPPAFVTGFFGMNTKNLPFGESEHGTLIAAFLCVLAGLLVFAFLRRSRMLT